MTKTAPRGVLWVCRTCLFAREYAEQTEGNHGRKPWSREPDTEVTLGIPWYAHRYDCKTYETEGKHRDEDGCSCEVEDSSTEACDACGDPHHGERYAYTWWSA